MQHFDATRTDFAPYGFTCELWSPQFMPRPDRHNEIEINLLRSGSLTYLLGGRLTVIKAGIALFWAAIPHQIVNYEDAAPYYVATLPLAWFLGCGFPQELAHRSLSGEIVSETAGREDEALFEKWAEDFATSGAPTQWAAQLEIQARLLRLALALPAQKATVKAPVPDASLSRADQIACYIAQNYSEPLCVAQIANAVNLHPNYAMTLFNKAFGTTISDFLTQHRLSHAQRLLVISDAPIIEIAADAGFQSLSRFNEVFKSCCACSPRAYRNAHKAAIAVGSNIQDR